MDTHTTPAKSSLPAPGLSPTRDSHMLNGRSRTSAPPAIEKTPPTPPEPITEVSVQETEASAPIPHSSSFSSSELPSSSRSTLSSHGHSSREHACPFGMLGRDRKEEYEDIESVLRNILREVGLFHVDVSPYVKVMHDNLIHTTQQLRMLTPEALKTLKLPLILYSGLVGFAPTRHHEPPLVLPSESTLPSIASLPMGHQWYAVSSRASTGSRSAVAAPSTSTRSSEDSVCSSTGDISPTTSLSDLRFSEVIATGSDASSNVPYAPTEFLGLTNATRLMIRGSWDILGAQTKDFIWNFYAKFYTRLIQEDPVARHIFALGGIDPPMRSIHQALSLIMRALDEPEEVETLVQHVSISHLIMGIDKPSFVAFGKCLAQSLEDCLGSIIMTADVKEAWIQLVRRLSDVILAEYPRVEAGIRDMMWHKIKGRWKLCTVRLTHKALLLFKDNSETKLRAEFDLSTLKCSIIPMVATDAPTEFPFGLQHLACGKQFWFAAPSEDKYSTWIDELNIRLKAYELMRKVVKGQSQTNISPSPKQHRSDWGWPWSTFTKS